MPILSKNKLIGNLKFWIEVMGKKNQNKFGDFVKYIFL